MTDRMRDKKLAVKLERSCLAQLFCCITFLSTCLPSVHTENIYDTSRLALPKGYHQERLDLRFIRKSGRQEIPTNFLGGSQLGNEIGTDSFTARGSFAERTQTRTDDFRRSEKRVTSDWQRDIIHENERRSDRRNSLQNRGQRVNSADLASGFEQLRRQLSRKEKETVIPANPNYFIEHVGNSNEGQHNERVSTQRNAFYRNSEARVRQADDGSLDRNLRERRETRTVNDRRTSRDIGSLDQNLRERREARTVNDRRTSRLPEYGDRETREDLYRDLRRINRARVTRDDTKTRKRQFENHFRRQTLRDAEKSQANRINRQVTGEYARVRNSFDRVSHSLQRHEIPENKEQRRQNDRRYDADRSRRQEQVFRKNFEQNWREVDVEKKSQGLARSSNFRRKTDEFIEESNQKLRERNVNDRRSSEPGFDRRMNRESSRVSRINQKQIREQRDAFDNRLLRIATGDQKQKRERRDASANRHLRIANGRNVRNADESLRILDDEIIRESRDENARLTRNIYPSSDGRFQLDRKNTISVRSRVEGGGRVKDLRRSSEDEKKLRSGQIRSNKARHQSMRDDSLLSSRVMRSASREVSRRFNSSPRETRPYQDSDNNRMYKNIELTPRNLRHALKDAPQNLIQRIRTRTSRSTNKDEARITLGSRNERQVRRFRRAIDSRLSRTEGSEGETIVSRLDNSIRSISPNSLLSRTELISSKDTPNGQRAQRVLGLSRFSEKLNRRQLYDVKRSSLIRGSNVPANLARKDGFSVTSFTPRVSAEEGVSRTERAAAFKRMKETETRLDGLSSRLSAREDRYSGERGSSSEKRTLSQRIAKNPFSTNSERFKNERLRDTQRIKENRRFEQVSEPRVEADQSFRTTRNFVRNTEKNTLEKVRQTFGARREISLKHERFSRTDRNSAKESATLKLLDETLSLPRQTQMHHHEESRIRNVRDIEKKCNENAQGMQQCSRLSEARHNKSDKESTLRRDRFMNSRDGNRRSLLSSDKQRKLFKARESRSEEEFIGRNIFRSPHVRNRHSSTENHDEVERRVQREYSRGEPAGGSYRPVYHVYNDNEVRESFNFNRNADTRLSERGFSQRDARSVRSEQSLMNLQTSKPLHTGLDFELDQDGREIRRILRVLNNKNRNMREFITDSRYRSNLLERTLHQRFDESHSSQRYRSVQDRKSHLSRRDGFRQNVIEKIKPSFSFASTYVSSGGHLIEEQEKSDLGKIAVRMSHILKTQASNNMEENASIFNALSDLIINAKSLFLFSNSQFWITCLSYYLTFALLIASVNYSDKPTNLMAILLSPFRLKMRGHRIGLESSALGDQPLSSSWASAVKT